MIWWPAWFFSPLWMIAITLSPQPHSTMANIHGIPSLNRFIPWGRSSRNSRRSSSLRSATSQTSYNPSSPIQTIHGPYIDQRQLQSLLNQKFGRDYKLEVSILTLLRELNWLIKAEVWWIQVVCQGGSEWGGDQLVLPEVNVRGLLVVGV